ncbi:MAG: Lar family restriction alleviation protein [Morganella sp. (in: enterobacteria)]
MTEKTQKLKPCPFCGSDDVEILIPYQKKDDSVLIYCFGCDLRIKKSSTPEAITAWNRRSPQCEKE